MQTCHGVGEFVRSSPKMSFSIERNLYQHWSLPDPFRFYVDIGRKNKEIDVESLYGLRFGSRATIKHRALF